MKNLGNIFALNVQEGKKYMPQEQVYRSVMQNLKDGNYILSIKKLSKKRSLAQNSYYWFVMTLVADELGYEDPKDVHEGMKMQFLVDNSKRIPFIGSTTKLSTQEMADFMNRCFKFIEGLGIKIPSPEEAYILIANDE